MRRLATIKQVAVTGILALSFSLFLLFDQIDSTAEQSSREEFSQDALKELRDLLRSSVIGDKEVRIETCRIYFVEQRTTTCDRPNKQFKKEQILNLKHLDVPVNTMELSGAKAGQSGPVGVVRFPHAEEYQDDYLSRALEYESVRERFEAEIGDALTASDRALRHMVDKYGEQFLDNSTVFTYCDGRRSAIIRKSDYEMIFVSLSEPERALNLLRKQQQLACDVQE